MLPSVGRSVSLQLRTFTTTASMCGRKSREPFDKRFPITGKHINGTRKSVERGGNPWYPAYVGTKMARDNPAVITYVDRSSERKIMKPIPEMVPEFVVPDLTSFLLKPYVSYKVPKVVQSEFTAKDLFDATYGQELRKASAELQAASDSAITPAPPVTSR